MTIADATLLERAREILARAPLVDGHNDVLWAVRTKSAYDFDALDLAEDRPELMTDLARLRAGGMGGQYWSVYVASDMPGDTAVTATLEQIDALHTMVGRYPDALAFARTADDVERAAGEGKVASMVGVEGGQSIGSSLGALRMLARMGAGYMTLTHNHNTPWADSATDRPVHKGLTRFGEEVVREMNRCGVLVDLSHVSADTMAHAMDVSEAPVIFSHSSARALSAVPRNVPDDILERVRDAAGVVMVTFVPMFLVPEGADMSDAYIEAEAKIREELGDDTPEAHEAMEAWWDEHPMPPAELNDAADHIDHVRDVAGIDHIGIGGDYDGTSSMPAGLEDVSKYPDLFAELLGRGYSEEDLAKIARGNILRVMRESERVAERLQRERPPSRARIDDPVDGDALPEEQE
jgi:membrane dipeptidase